MAGVTRHTLRFWEKELEGVIVPLRTKGRQRRYTVDQLFIIEEIKRLKTQGYSLSDVAAVLKNPIHRAKINNPGFQSIDLLADRVREMVRSAISDFFEGKQT